MNATSIAGRRVLIVEDEMLVAMGLEDMLTDLGYEIVGVASRTDQALAMLGNESIDAVVLDINLHGEMSFPVADALTARNVPFLFSTGYERSSLAGRFSSCPAIQKPFSTEELGRAIEGLFDRRR